MEKNGRLIISKKPFDLWYKDGLKFKCTECGKCCTGAPGYVWLTEEDIERLSKHFELTREEFIKKHVRFVGKRLSLNEIPKTYDCEFFKDNKCSVYQARPKQCRKFPFWDENLKDPVAWAYTGSQCEGVGHVDAPVIPVEEIERIRKE